MPPAEPALSLDAFEAQNRAAELALARLSGVSGLVSSAEYSAIRKEALLTSQIEGTQATLTDLFDEEAGLDVSNADDIEEVTNYLRAYRLVRDNLRNPGGLPISVRLMCDAHRLLLDGARGSGKQPGELRRSQNWIGGTRPGNAVFVPPPADQMPRLLGDLEKFIHSASPALPPLVNIALVHAQFETIHPFLDGNGRVGRLMITLYLVCKGILKQPILYLSDFFERNRPHYYDKLMRVREKNDLEQWFRFFLVGIIETARNGIATFDNILKLQKKVDAQLQTLGSRTANAHRLLNELYQRPVTDAARVAKTVKIAPASAYKLIADLERFGILREMTGGKRGKLYTFDAYVSLFR